MTKIMRDNVARALDAILEIVPDMENAEKVIAQKLLKFGNDAEKEALVTLVRSVGEVARLAADARRGGFRERGHKQ